jgi:hypothetical protein
MQQLGWLTDIWAAQRAAVKPWFLQIIKGEKVRHTNTSTVQWWDVCMHWSINAWKQRSTVIHISVGDWYLAEAIKSLIGYYQGTTFNRRKNGRWFVPGCCPEFRSSRVKKWDWMLHINAPVKYKIENFVGHTYDSTRNWWKLVAKLVYPIVKCKSFL